MNAKVSVIMPSFNVARYIRECMESIVNQTLKDIEIICVDAHSTDGTRDILEEYRRHDERIVILNDDEKSCGYSYNIGIEHATGEYVGFLETDDYVKNDMFETLYEIAHKNNLDYVKANHIPFITIDDNHRWFEEERIFKDNTLKELYGKVFNPRIYPEILWPDHCMWNGIYNATFLKHNHIKLNQSKGASYQDHGFQWQTMCLAQKVMYLDVGLYFYRKDNEFSSMKSPTGIFKDYQEFIFVKEFIKECDAITPQHWWIFYQKMLGAINSWFSALLMQSPNLSMDAIKVLELYIKELREGMANNYISLSKIGIDKYFEANLLLTSKQEYINYLKHKISTIKTYRDMFMKTIENLTEIVIVCAGHSGKELFRLLGNERRKVDCFCDNNVKIQGELFSKKVEPIEKAIRDFPNAYFVIANEQFYMDLWRQLQKYGLNDDKIIFFKELQPII